MASRPRSFDGPRERRLLILAEGFSADAHFGKTACGVIRYRREEVVAILDSERIGESDEGIPVVATVEESLPFEPTTALVGVATQGGRFPQAWRELLKHAIASGLDIENGLHEFISEDAELAALAAQHGIELRDLRKPPEGLNVPTGENLTHGARVVLMVGSDCAVGKMTVALELDAEAKRRGVASQFVPTGQTGMAIAGWGLAIDAVVSDFLAGATESLVLEGIARGGELLWVEGQGSLTHPAYSGVTMGLLHGSAPHELILCHIAGQLTVDDNPSFPMPSLSELIALYEHNTLIARRAKVVAIALNTRTLDDAGARAAIAAAETETGLPAGDPVRFGAAGIVDSVLDGDAARSE